MAETESKREDRFETAVRGLLRKADENRNYVVGAVAALIIVAGAIYFRMVSTARQETAAWDALRTADTTGLLRERWKKYDRTSAGVFLADELARKLFDEQRDMADKTEEGTVEKRLALLDEGIQVLEEAVDRYSRHSFEPHLKRMLDVFRQEKGWVETHGAEILASKEPIPKEVTPDPEKMNTVKYVEDKPGTNPIVTLKTDRGDITVELFQDDAPNHVANFVSLVLEKFFDGLVFHRVEDWVIQSGCPDGTGSGDPGYRLRAEITKHGHDRGAFGMARGDDLDSAGSQFYIVKRASHDIDGKYTIFGRVLSGMDVVDRIKKGDRLIEVVADRLRSSEYRPRVIYTGPRPSQKEGQ